MESLFHDFAYDALTKMLLFVASSGCSFTGAYMYFSTLKLPTWCLILFCVALAALAAYIVLSIASMISNRYTRAEKVESNYVILDKTVTFKYDGTKCYYTSEIKLHFNKKTQEYYGKFYWSGSGGARIKTVNRNYRLNELKRRTRYIEYAVLFDRAHKKGQKLTLKLNGVMEDPRGEFSPYFSTTIHDPTKKLTVVLQIDPSAYPIEELEKDIIPPTRCNHENCERVYLDDAGTYTWEIPNPILGYQYSLNWTFKP